MRIKNMPKKYILFWVKRQNKTKNSIDKTYDLKDM